ncbi:sugar dehydrogenase complex small subunit [Rhizobium sp. NPDC090275]|uniref:sugar dehydrogenase complex small subunit n=1 Tax=Rhizobium sp. NPDC090275 TaxID=3364498 RepID=UPI00383A2C4A
MNSLSETPADIWHLATQVSRRSLLSGTAALVLSVALPSALWAQEAAPAKSPQFYAVSTAITAKPLLSGTTSDRIYEALLSDHPDLAEQVDALAVLAAAQPDANAFKQAAEQAGHGNLLLAILTAWYTGTVDTKKGPVVVAYKDALMYRPVEDGLTVPTYCNKGPMWWTGLPPEMTRMPINNPKVL